MPQTLHKFVHWLCNNIIYFILMQNEELTFKTNWLVTFVTVYLKILDAAPVFECNCRVSANSILTWKLKQDILPTQARFWRCSTVLQCCRPRSYKLFSKPLTNLKRLSVPNVYFSLFTVNLCAYNEKIKLALSFERQSKLLPSKRYACT